MIALLLLLSLAIVVLACAARYHANRAENLETLLAESRFERSRLRNHIVDLRSQLDDAEREYKRLQVSNAHLIREASTMEIDLYRTDAEARYLRGCVAQLKAVRAGAMLMGIREAA